MTANPCLACGPGGGADRVARLHPPAAPRRQRRPRRAGASAQKLLRSAIPHRFTHDSTVTLATIDRRGRDSGVYDTYIRTDSQWITSATYPRRRAMPQPNYFDAVFLSFPERGGTDEQKRASSRREGGRQGVVAAHTGNAAFYQAGVRGMLADISKSPWNVTRQGRRRGARLSGTKHFPETFSAKESSTSCVTSRTPRQGPSPRPHRPASVI